MRLLLVMIFLGLTACNVQTSDAAFCEAAYTKVIADLRYGLVQHPETHADVGEPAVSAVLGHEAGCRQATLALPNWGVTQ